MLMNNMMAYAEVDALLDLLEDEYKEKLEWIERDL